MNSNKLGFMRKIPIYFLLVLCLGLNGRVQSKDMSLPLSSAVNVTYDLDLKSSDLRREISLDAAIGEILRSDLKARKSILEAKLPDDLSDRQFTEKLIDYANVRLVNDAKRLEELYRTGDEVWVFENTSSDRKSEGFLLMRNNEILHFVVLELILT